jgi:hypothetical protein
MYKSFDGTRWGSCCSPLPSLRTMPPPPEAIQPSLSYGAAAAKQDTQEADPTSTNLTTGELSAHGKGHAALQIISFQTLLDLIPTCATCAVLAES